MESRKAAVDLSVLRHRGPLQGRRGDRRDRGARSRQGVARVAGRGARVADREADRPVPELQGGHRLRPRARRAELRVLRIPGARGLQGDQGADPPAEPAALQDQPVAGPRTDSAAGTRANGWHRTRSRPARSSTACTASISRTGRSTRTPTARGKRRRAITTTRPRRCAGTDGPRRGRSATCGGSRPRAGCGISSTTSRCPVRMASR